MQIYCPKCKTGYEIEVDVVPENGRKLRCAVCGKVFKCLPEDLIDGSALRSAEFTKEEKERLDDKGYLQEVEAEVQVLADSKENIPQEAEIDEVLEEDVAEETDILPDSQSEVVVAKSLEELEAEERLKQDKNVEDIFQRLSQETEALFKAENEEKPVKKYWLSIKKILGLQNPRNYKYYFIVFSGMILLSLYYARFEVVRSASFMAPIYNLFGIKATVTGEGLEFQNVYRREYEEDYVRKFEIKGFIANKTDRTIDIPTINVELLDKDARPIQAEETNSVIPLVTAHGKIPFSLIVDKPSPLTKYIYLTFSGDSAN